MALCVGDSHLASVLLAAELRGDPLEAVVLRSRPRHVVLEHPVSIEKSGGLSSRTLGRVARADRVFTFIGGIDHQALGLRDHPLPFDVVLPGSLDLPVEERSELIPVAALRHELERRSAHSRELVRQIAGAARGPVFQFQPPPPPAPEWVAERSQRFRRMLEKKPEAARSHPLIATATPESRHAPIVRQKLWRLQSDVLADAADEAGARFVPCPPEAIDEAGFLRADLCLDPIHGNAAYGELVVRQMDALG